MDVAKDVEDHGWSFYVGPSERRWSEGTLRAAQGRMTGLAFLVPFGAMPKGTRPGGRNQNPQATGQ